MMGGGFDRSTGTPLSSISPATALLFFVPFRSIRVLLFFWPVRFLFKPADTVIIVRFLSFVKQKRQKPNKYHDRILSYDR